MTPLRLLFVTAELAPLAKTGGLADVSAALPRDLKAHGHDVPELTDDVKRDIAAAVGVGAIKYADLSQNRTSDYVFDYDKMLATEGNTATYMQYAYARCRSIFRKENIADARFRTDPPAVVISHTAERALALQLLRFPEAGENAAADYLPHLVTDEEKIAALRPWLSRTCMKRTQNRECQAACPESSQSFSFGPQT